VNVFLLPGIVAPAAVRYAPLLECLPGLEPVPKDLEVYAGVSPPDSYSIAVEIQGIDRAASAAGFDRFHLYGHSGGGAVALAYTAAHPERVLSLAVDEPASDFTEADFADAAWARLDEAATLPDRESMRRFLALQLAPGVDPPQPPPGPPPPWMATRPAGMRALVAALRTHRVDSAAYTAFAGPVYYSFGSLSNARWVAMKERLSKAFPDFTAERYEGLHHLHTSHQAAPERVAQRLLEIWTRAEKRRPTS
jgi:pimeloyl-ACP methyl ester carboxylesterase